MKKQIFNFIKQKNPGLQKVISFKVKDKCDKNGFVGEHYKVKCMLRLIDPGSPTGFNRNVEKICLVNIEEFIKWIKSERSIIWE